MLKLTIENSLLMTSIEESKINDRAHLIKLVRRWGGLATDAILDSACQIFSIPQVEGFIGYRVKYSCAVVYGDPVCAPSDIPQLTQTFHHFCQERYRNIIYVMVSENFAKWAIQNLCKTLIEYGEEIYLDPHSNPKEKHGTHASLVRRKVRHAQHEGVCVKEYFPHDNKMEQAIEEVGKVWLKSRRGPQIHISNVHLFSDRLGKRWFYAQQGEKIIGVVVLNQLESRQGWHLNHLMFTPDAPGGTPELLIVSVLEVLQSEDCSFVSFGIAPIPQLGEITGLTKISTWMTRRAYKIAGRIFHLQGHKTFWGKFFSQTHPSYLLFRQPHIGLREIFALMRVMHASL